MGMTFEMKRATHKCQPTARHALASALVSISDTKEMETFLEELLTRAEICDVTLRWRLLELLSQGVSQRKIAEDLQISLCKITRGSRILKSKNAISNKILKDVHVKS